MTRYPILFNRRDLVEGNGFIARVGVAGRVLLTQEDGEFWAEGINPGGLAAQGESQGEALAAFCLEYQAVLFDIASDAPTFEVFRTEVGRFFNETSEIARVEWYEAVEEVRAGKITADWLRTRPADSPLHVEVSLAWQPKAENNEEGDAAIAA